MTALAPTARQLEVLAVIADFTADRQFPPTIREIGGALNITSTNAVAEHLVRLERLGLLERTATTARGIRITDLGQKYLTGRRAA